MVFTVAVWLGRKRLLANTIGRQLTLTLGAVLTGGLCSDVQSHLVGASVHAATVQRFTVGAFALVVGGLGIERTLLVSAAMMLTAASAMALCPGATELVGTVATLLVVLSFVWSARRTRRSTSAQE